MNAASPAGSLARDLARDFFGLGLFISASSFAHCDRWATIFCSSEWVISLIDTESSAKLLKTMPLTYSLDSTMKRATLNRVHQIARPARV